MGRDYTAAEETVRQRFALLATSLDERRRRLVAAAEAIAWGWGGINHVASATGLSRDVMQAGIAELRTPVEDRLPVERIRRAGGGRKRTVNTDPTL